MRSRCIALKHEKHPIAGSYLDRSTASHILYGQNLGTLSLRNISEPIRSNQQRESGFSDICQEKTFLARAICTVNTFISACRTMNLQYSFL